MPQSVINAGGRIRNTVSVTSTEAAPASAFVETLVIQRPSLSVTKTADRLTVNSAGQVIRFSIKIRNTGNMDLNNLQVRGGGLLFCFCSSNSRAKTGC